MNPQNTATEKDTTTAKSTELETKKNYTESKISKVLNVDDFSLPLDFNIEHAVIPQSENTATSIFSSPTAIVTLIATLIIAYKNRNNDNSIWKYKPYSKKTLFRYRPFDENTIDTLENHYIYHSSVAHFNDPYDCMAKQAFSLYKDETSEGLDKEFEELEDLLQHTAVACFSKTQKSLLMWSHYARNHSGICIEYYTKELHNDDSRIEMEILKDTHKDYISKNINFFKGFFEIKYAQKMIAEKDESAGKDLVSLPDIFLRKYTNWSYEKEIRRTIYVANPTIKKSRKFYHKPEAIKAIYIGAKANPNTIKNILDIVKHCYSNKVKVYKAELLPNSYELKFEPVEIL